MAVLIFLAVLLVGAVLGVTLTAYAPWVQPGVTVSAWAGMQIRGGLLGHPWGQWLGFVLNSLQPAHCELAIEAETAKAQKVLAYLNAAPAVERNVAVKGSAAK